MNYVVFDLDGCLSNDHWRLNRIPPSPSSPEDWKEYHELSLHDCPANLGTLKAFMTNGVVPMFVTARPESFRAQTVAWLRDKVSVPAGEKTVRLLMRPFNNTQPSPDLKQGLIEEWKKNNPDASIIMAFDDREDVVERYGEMGIEAEVLQAYPRHTSTAPRAGEVLGALEDMIRTVESRTGTYGANYDTMGKVMAALFPTGVPFEILSKEQFHLFELAVLKIVRYALTGLRHKDSIHDAGVYCAMCSAIGKHDVEEGK